MYWIFYQGICHNSFILWVVHIISYIHLYSCWMLLSYFVWAYTLHSFHHMYSILVGYEKTHGERSMILCLQMFLKKIITKKWSINAFFWWMADIYFAARYNRNSAEYQIIFIDGNYHCVNKSPWNRKYHERIFWS